MPNSATDTTLETLWLVAERARKRGTQSREDKEFAQRALPAAFASFPDVKLPRSIRHPAGFTVSGAPVGTFFKGAILVSGQKALGRRFSGDQFFEAVERDLALNIMRSNFHHGYPKGTFCCVQCTLAVLPVLDAQAIRFFECSALADDVRRIVHNREWRFSGAVNPVMLRWSLGED